MEPGHKLRLHRHFDASPVRLTKCIQIKKSVPPDETVIKAKMRGLDELRLLRPIFTSEVTKASSCLGSAARLTYAVAADIEYVDFDTQALAVDWTMNDLLDLLTQHGYTLLALIVFLAAVGFPMPAALALVAAGAAIAHNKLSPLVAFGVSVLSILLGDFVLFLVGRHSGWAFLGLLCRISANPESCILRSAESFYRRGKATLVLAKFIPGFKTIAQPLAGSMKMRTSQFLQFDAAGACLYVLAYGGLGFIFSDFLREIVQGLRSARHSIELVMVLGVTAYVAYRIRSYRKYRFDKLVPRVAVEEVVCRLTSKAAARILLVDVRSHGYYDTDALRIKGSIRIEPNNLAEEIKELPGDKEIYLYCT